MTLTDFERKVLDDISKDRCWQHVKWFAGQGEKLSGTPNNEKAVDYILENLKNIGIKFSAPRFQAWLGFPKIFEAEVKIIEPEKRALDCIALAQCASASVEGELVYVGGGRLKDYNEVNVRNKIVLVDFSKPPARPWKNYVAGVLKGAVGQIIISHAGPKRALNRGTVKSVWGNPTPENVNEIGRIPVVNISREDGEYLVKQLEKSPIRIKMKAEGERGFYGTRQPMAKIDGESSAFVLLGSHMDAWGAAASCNALGCASTLESARIMSKYRSKLRRGMEFLWFQGHETGIMTGSTWYVDNYWDNLNRNCVAYLNNDTTSMIHSTLYTADGDPAIRDFLISTVRELAEDEGAEFKEPTPKYRPYKYGDQSFYGIGVPSVRVQTTFTPEGRKKVGSGGGWWYHSEYDTLDKCDIETMYMAEKAQTLVLIRLCTLPVLPYRIERIADWTIDALKELDNPPDENLSLREVQEQAIMFKKVASKLDEASSKLTQQDKVGEKIHTTNNCIMKLSRIMNPVNYTLRGKYDHDYYGAEYVQPIPLLRSLAELEYISPDSTEYYTIMTKLTRARNIVLDSLREAVFITKFAVKSIKS